ncbi:hypothetical protein P8A22_15075 [Streptomyces laculatispora]|uniref:Integral membrane protein n=1 Tax=Streptomyces laculatispora TaxID=887464 RepID=A0ABY9I2U7_9ACTN|nr:hypothetical protein [Streptomyces laculatispora]WLQ41193.1 hypothetical protein P8A22_15075 [Streptomyces laculatispora]
MLRHEIRPGRAVAGMVMLGLAAGYAADAAGLWHVPWTFFVALFAGGLWIAVLTTWVSYRIRRRRDARRASTEKDAAPPSSSGSQAMR